mgnify:CR=1 FL=1
MTDAGLRLRELRLQGRWSPQAGAPSRGILTLNQARLDAAGVAYDLRLLPGGGLWQLFCHCPNGARVELDFDGAEAP